VLPPIIALLNILACSTTDNERVLVNEQRLIANEMSTKREVQNVLPPIIALSNILACSTSDNE
jgi:hypothetical protein